MYKCSFVVLLIALLSPPAKAIIIRHDVPDVSYQSYNPAVVYLFTSTGGNAGSGAVIAPNWVLTSAQVAEGIQAAGNLVSAGVITGANVFQSGESPFGPGIKSLHFAPGWSGDVAADNNLALVELNIPATLSNFPGIVNPFQRLSSSVTSLVGNQITIAGYGDTGTGHTGLRQVIETGIPKLS